MALISRNQFLFFTFLCVVVLGFGITKASDNFTVVGPVGSTLQKVESRFESARIDDIKMMFPAQIIKNWRNKIPVTYTESTKISGFTSFDNGIHVVITGPLDWTLDNVIPHEVMHVICGVHYGSCGSRWLAEGNACYPEAISSRTWLDSILSDALKQDKCYSTPQLMGFRDYPERRSIFYAQSASYIRFIRLHGDFLAFYDSAMQNSTKAVTDRYTTLQNFQDCWFSWYLKGQPSPPTISDYPSSGDYPSGSGFTDRDSRISETRTTDRGFVASEYIWDSKMGKWVMPTARNNDDEILHFYADWCGPCQAQLPAVQDLKNKGYVVTDINTDTNQALALKYGITSIPAYVYHGRTAHSVDELCPWLHARVPVAPVITPSVVVQPPVTPPIAPTPVVTSPVVVVPDPPVTTVPAVTVPAVTVPAVTVPVVPETTKTDPNPGTTKPTVIEKVDVVVSKVDKVLDSKPVEVATWLIPLVAGAVGIPIGGVLAWGLGLLKARTIVKNTVNSTPVNTVPGVTVPVTGFPAPNTGTTGIPNTGTQGGVALPRDLAEANQILQLSGLEQRNPVFDALVGRIAQDVLSNVINSTVSSTAEKDFAQRILNLLNNNVNLIAPVSAK